MATQPLTIDVQVHAYERNHPGRPWAGFLQGPDQVTGDDMVEAMDKVGVDGAIRSLPSVFTSTTPVTPLRYTRNTPAALAWSDHSIPTRHLRPMMLRSGRPHPAL